MPAFRRRSRRAALVLAASAASAAVLGTAACTAAPSVPVVDFPSAATVQPYSVVVTPVPKYTGYAPPFGAVKTTISGLSADTVLSYTKVPDWVDFTVTLTNTSSASFVDIEPLVVFGQCPCNPGNYDLAPHTSVQLWESDTQAWKNITTADLNPRLGFSEQQQVPGIDLGPKAFTSFDYRMVMVSTLKEPGLVSGDSSLNVYVLQLPGRSRISVGQAPDATAALTYHIG